MDGGLLVAGHGRGHVGLGCGRRGHSRGEGRGGLRVNRDFLADAATGPSAVLAAGGVATGAGRAGVTTVGLAVTVAALAATTRGGAVALPAIAAQAQSDQDAAVTGLAAEHAERLGEIDRRHRRGAGPLGSGRRGDGVRPTPSRRTAPPRRPKAREVVAPGPSSFPRPGSRTPPQGARRVTPSSGPSRNLRFYAAINTLAKKPSRPGLLRAGQVSCFPPWRTRRRGGGSTNQGDHRPSRPGDAVVRGCDDCGRLRSCGRRAPVPGYR